MPLWAILFFAQHRKSLPLIVFVLGFSSFACPWWSISSKFLVIVATNRILRFLKTIVPITDKNVHSTSKKLVIIYDLHQQLYTSDPKYRSVAYSYFNFLIVQDPLQFEAIFVPNCFSSYLEHTTNGYMGLNGSVTSTIVLISSYPNLNLFRADVKQKVTVHIQSLQWNRPILCNYTIKMCCVSIPLQSNYCTFSIFYYVV